MKSRPAGFLGGFSDLRLMLKAAAYCMCVCVCAHGVIVYVGNRFSSMESVRTDCDGKLVHAYNLNNTSKHMSTIRVLSMTHHSTILGKIRRS